MCAHSMDFCKHCRCHAQCLQKVYAMINNDTVNDALKSCGCRVYVESVITIDY